MSRGGSPSSWRRILGDRRVQLGALGAAGLGLVVMLRRGGGGGGAGEQDRIVPATLDTTQQAVYDAMAELGGAWQRDLAGFQRQLTDLQSQLQRRPSGGTGSDPMRWGPAVTPVPAHQTPTAGKVRTPWIRPRPGG